MKKPTSLAKIKANRENARKSTGPKDTSLTRLNALQHGLLSKEVLMEGEDRQALVELGKRLRLELVPQGELENILVDRIVSSVWRLKRAIRVENGYLQAEYQDCQSGAFDGGKRSQNMAWNQVVSRELGYSNAWLNLMRYETSIERQIFKALHELLRLQSARRGEKPLLPVAVNVDVSAES